MRESLFRIEQTGVMSISTHKGTNYEMEVGDAGEGGEDQGTRRSEKEQQWRALKRSWFWERALRNRGTGL